MVPNSRWCRGFSRKVFTQASWGILAGRKQHSGPICFRNRGLGVVPSPGLLAMRGDPPAVGSPKDHPKLRQLEMCGLLASPVSATSSRPINDQHPLPRLPVHERRRPQAWRIGAPRPAWQCAASMAAQASCRQGQGHCRSGHKPFPGLRTARPPGGLSMITDAFLSARPNVQRFLSASTDTRRCSFER
jgi:hypothetical protein